MSKVKFAGNLRKTLLTCVYIELFGAQPWKRGGGGELARSNQRQGSAFDKLVSKINQISTK